MTSQGPEHQQDPRLNKQSYYNRDEIVSDIQSFYKFLPHVHASAIHHAPATGWVRITDETLSQQGIHKTPEAVELLRHLPYLGGPWPWIITSSFACDYRVVGEELNVRTKPGWLYDAADAQWPPWVVQLTAGRDREGHCYMLDTSDGTVARHCATGIYSQYSPSYAVDDVRSWRDRLCDPELWTLRDLLDEWRNMYRMMEVLGVPQPIASPGQIGSPDIYSRSGQDTPGHWRWEEAEELRTIYRENGWPDEYNKEACIVALRRWWQAHETG